LDKRRLPARSPTLLPAYGESHARRRPGNPEETGTRQSPAHPLPKQASSFRSIQWSSVHPRRQKKQRDERESRRTREFWTARFDERQCTSLRFCFSIELAPSAQVSSGTSKRKSKLLPRPRTQLHFPFRPAF